MLRDGQSFEEYCEAMLPIIRERLRLSRLALNRHLREVPPAPTSGRRPSEKTVAARQRKMHIV